MNHRSHPASLAALLLLVLLPASARTQDITATLRPTEPLKKTPLKLSEYARVTLVVEGPTPLSVELPLPLKPDMPPESALLADESRPVWGIQFAGRPRVSTVGGRGRWEQDFRVEPFVPGDWLVKFALLKVNGREVEGPGIALTVDPSKVTAPHDATGIEKLPPLSPPAKSYAALWWAVGVLAVVSVVVVAWRVRSRPAPVDPAAWAVGAFDRLEQEQLPGAVLAARVADVLREFVDRLFGIPATKFTTSELLAAAGEQAVWSVEEADAIRRILDRCDLVKFAGDVPDDDGCRRLLAAVRDWVNHVSAAGSGPG